MMHDPFQNYATLGQVYGIPTQIGLQHPALQAVGVNPVTTLNPLLALSQLTQAGIPQQLIPQQLIPQQIGQSLYGQNPLQQGFINPHQQLQQQQQLQLQLASLVANNPLLAASLLNNPLVAATLQSQALGGAYGVPQFGVPQQSMYPQIGQQLGQQLGQLGQIGSPFGQQLGQLGQIGSPFGQIGYPLAPQSWIGQGAQFGPGQAFGQRPFQPQGFSPWGY